MPAAGNANVRIGPPVGGVATDVTHDLQLAAARAHLDLIGGVSLFLL
jgi:hypothetical protein